MLAGTEHRPPSDLDVRGDELVGETQAPRWRVGSVSAPTLVDTDARDHARGRDLMRLGRSFIVPS